MKRQTLCLSAAAWLAAFLLAIPHFSSGEEPAGKKHPVVKDELSAKEEPLVKNLRVLSVALNKYLQDHGSVWPQSPTPKDLKGAAHVKWWSETLKPYGVEPQHLIDPTDKSAGHGVMITAFDDLPNTAFRWPAMPWAVVQCAATQRFLCLLPDGRVMEQSELSKILPPFPGTR